MSKSLRDPEKEKYWREILADQQKSGLSQAEYCRAHGLNENSFSWWKREIPARDRQARREKAQARKLARVQASSAPAEISSFVPLVFAAEEEPPAPEVDCPVEIRFPGATVRIHAGVEASAIRSVILAFRECWF